MRKQSMETNEKYIPRIVDKLLEFDLRSAGAIWIKGPKSCGKSTTVEQFARSSVNMQDADTHDLLVLKAKNGPSAFLDNEPPFLIDEWQEIPFIWNQIKIEVDKRNEFGQFIITGSKNPPQKVMEELHSGEGRFTIIVMRPMTLYESGESSGEISIRSLFNGESPEPAQSKATPDDYAFYVARGGWPQAIGKERDVALIQAVNYYKMLVKTGLSQADGVKRDPAKVDRLLRSYARNCGTQASYATMGEDVSSGDGPISENTVASYIKALKNIYVVDESEAWNPNIRSKTAIRTGPTRYFVDPSLTCAALGLGPEGILLDSRLFGFLFEGLCIRDLRVYAENIDGTVKHYRDKNGRECDAVITLRDNSWAAIEIKLGASKEAIDAAASGLLALNDDVEGRPPSFLMVLTATNVAYKRDDGVWVVPLACLGP